MGVTPMAVSGDGCDTHTRPTGGAPLTRAAQGFYSLTMTIDKGSKSSSRADDRSAQPAASPIVFRLEPGSGVPTYLQLVQQVEQSLRLGYLTQGDQLPTVKEAVAALAINPNTVLKAYRELEHKGLAAGRPGQGTFIAGTLRRVGLAEQAELRADLLTWMRTAADAGLDFDGIEALFAASMRDFRERRDGAQTQGQQPARTARGVA